MSDYSNRPSGENPYPDPDYRPGYHYDWRYRPASRYNRLNPFLKVVCVIAAIWLTVAILHGIFHFFWPILIIAGIIYFSRRHRWNHRPYYHGNYYQGGRPGAEPYYPSQ